MTDQPEKVFDPKQGKMADKSAEQKMTPEQIYMLESLKLLTKINNGVTFFVILALIGIILGLLAYCSPLH
jgi:hypothetical protein